MGLLLKESHNDYESLTIYISCVYINIGYFNNWERYSKCFQKVEESENYSQKIFSKYSILL